MEKRLKVETATAIANYEATDDYEISLVEGDFIEIYQKEGKGNFWFGKNLRGKLEGYFPASCVKTSRGKVGSVAATIGNSVLADDGQAKPSSPTKPALPPKPMISPKTMDNLSPSRTLPSKSETANANCQNDETNFVFNETARCLPQNDSVIQNNNLESDAPSENRTEKEFKVKAQLVSEALNKRLSLHATEVNSSEELPEFDDDDWEEDDMPVLLDMFVVAIAAYEPTGPEQLVLQIGDLIQVHQTTDSAWWRGQLMTKDGRPIGSVNWFPSSYVKSLGKEYHPFGETTSTPGSPRRTNKVKSSSSMRSILDVSRSLLSKVAATAAVVSDVSLWQHAVSSPKPEPSSPSSRFFIDHDPDKSHSDGSFNSEDSDYGTDQMSIASFSQLYTIHTMSPARPLVKSKAQQRIGIIYELVITEERFIKDIYFTLTNFQESLQSNGLLTDDEINLIFRNLRLIYEANYSLYDDLTARLGTEDGINTRICDLLEAHLPAMIPIYTSYCAGQTTAVAKVDAKCVDAYFGDFVKQISLQNETVLTLTQYLGKPIQRMLQYPHLLEQLLKNTEPECDDRRECCEEAVQCAKDFCRQVDNALSSLEEASSWKPYQNLSWLQTHLLTPDPDHLIDFNSDTCFLGPRVLLQAAFFQNVTTKATLVFFLLNDLLLLALPKKQIPSVRLVNHFFDCQEILQCKYVLQKRPFLLDEVTIARENINEVSMELQFNSPTSSLKLQAVNPAQYELFMSKLKAAKKSYETSKRLNVGDHMAPSVTFVTTPMTLLSLATIEAVQLYTRSYLLNVYCKLAIGTDWSRAHSLYTTKSIHVKLARNANDNTTVNSQISGNSIRKDPSLEQSITWQANCLLNIYSTDDLLMIRCFNENAFSPHQLLGEATLPVGEMLEQAKHLKEFTKGLPLKLPNEKLSRQLLANYQINPCLLVHFDLL